jgi:hypothetical protein
MKRKLVPLIDINDVRWQYVGSRVCPDSKFAKVYSNVARYLRDNFSFENQEALLVYGWQELTADGYAWVLNPIVRGFLIDIAHINSGYGWLLNPTGKDKLRNYKQIVPTTVINNFVDIKPTSDLTDFHNMVTLNEQGKRNSQTVMTHPSQVEEEEQKEADSKCLSFPDNIPCEDNDALIDDSQDYSEAMSELTEVFAKCKEETERELNLPADVQSQSHHTPAEETLAPRLAEEIIEHVQEHHQEEEQKTKERDTKLYETNDNATHLYIDDNTHIQQPIEEVIETVQPHPQDAEMGVLTTSNVQEVSQANDDISEDIIATGQSFHQCVEMSVKLGQQQKEHGTFEATLVKAKDNLAEIFGGK